MGPSTDLSLEGLICPGLEIFPVAVRASDHHHSLVLLICKPTIGSARRLGNDYLLVEPSFDLGSTA
jgi:hypothetical protein